MDILKVTYSTWKLLIQTNSFPYYHVTSAGDSVIAFTGDRETIYITDVQEAEHTDWAANYQSNSTEAATDDDAKAMVRGLSCKAVPVAMDGRRIVLPSTIGDSQAVQHTGFGDDITNGTRLNGQQFKAERTGAGQTVVQWQFMEWITEAGGVMHYVGAGFGDKFSYEIYAPASVGTSNPSSGMYNKMDVGGVNIFIPAAGDGDWDLNLSETLNANVDFTKLIPVPADNNDGFFNYDKNTNELTLAANQNGKYHLFDADISLIRMLNGICMNGNGTDDFNVPASYGAKFLLPHWKHKVTIDQVSAGTLQAAWHLFIGREKAYP